MATKNTSKTKQNTSAPAPAEVKADVSAPAAAPAAVEVVPSVVTEATPVEAAVTEAPLAGAGEGDLVDGLVPPIGDEQNLVTHAVAAIPDKGFCRAGMRWHREPIYVNQADWSDEQWAALTNEPMLIVTEL